MRSWWRRLERGEKKERKDGTSHMDQGLTAEREHILADAKLFEGKGAGTGGCSDGHSLFTTLVGQTIRQGRLNTGLL